jgi:tryptophan synthase beta chain
LERINGEPPLILVNLSGRGDKDVDTAISWFSIDTSGVPSSKQENTAQEARTADDPSLGELGKGDVA